MIYFTSLFFFQFIIILTPIPAATAAARSEIRYAHPLLPPYLHGDKPPRPQLFSEHPSHLSSCLLSDVLLFPPVPGILWIFHTKGAPATLRNRGSPTCVSRTATKLGSLQWEFSSSLHATTRWAWGNYSIWCIYYLILKYCNDPTWTSCLYWYKNLKKWIVE